MRAIPVQRVLAAQADLQKITFFEVAEDGGIVPMPSIVAFSPAVLLPAFIATARAISAAVWARDSNDVLGIEPPQIGRGILGVRRGMAAIDSTPEGLIRASIMNRALDIVCAQHAEDRPKVKDHAEPIVINASKMASYFQSEEGQQMLLGKILPTLDIEAETGGVFIPG